MTITIISAPYIHIYCDECGNEIHSRHQSLLVKQKNELSFCSTECGIAYRKKHDTWRKRDNDCEHMQILERCADKSITKREIKAWRKTISKGI